MVFYYRCSTIFTANQKGLSLLALVATLQMGESCHWKYSFSVYKVCMCSKGVYNFTFSVESHSYCSVVVCHNNGRNFKSCVEQALKNFKIMVLFFKIGSRPFPLPTSAS